MAVGIFAGIPVREFGTALEWYQRLLGREPTFYPNDVEAVWQLAENCHVYIIRDLRRAGGGVNMHDASAPRDCRDDRQVSTA